MDYNNTFTKRGHEYSYAIHTYPNAMDEEFRTAIKVCNINPNDILLNIPSACIPLEKYFQTVPKQYFRYETNKEFASLVGDSVCSWTSIPLPDSYCSKIICLASLHHATNIERKEIFREFWRLLCPGGSIIIGDVLADSPQDAWLNIFVDKMNPNGHKGQFWSNNDCKLFTEQGFEVKMENYSYPWKFDCEKDMIDFSKNLFGITNATDNEIRDALQSYLGATDTTIPWNLVYFIATKPQTVSPN